jgi:hypothetical protein
MPVVTIRASEAWYAWAVRAAESRGCDLSDAVALALAEWARRGGYPDRPPPRTKPRGRVKDRDRDGR